MTRRPYAEVIGDPVAHSKSPLIHNFWLGRMGIDAEYRACRVSPEELADYFASRRTDIDWRGCNVTIPHKEKVAGHIDKVAPRAGRIGAVNTVWKDGGLLRGCNTDVEGVAEAIRGMNLIGKSVVVIGAGGAARSAFAGLEGAGCREVRVLARSADKARDVLAGFDLPGAVYAIDDRCAFSEASLVINATQLGMNGQAEMPAATLEALDRMAPDGMVFDMVYAPPETGLLKAAARAGRTPVGGLTMLVGQARNAFARFFGQAPPREHDAELRALLTA